MEYFVWEHIQEYNISREIQYNQLIYVFRNANHAGLAPNEYRCLIPECHENYETATVLDFGSGIFWKDEHGTDYCTTYPLLKNRSSSSQCSIKDFNLSITNKENMVNCNPHSSGQIVIYGDFGMNSTAVTEFGLICKDQYKVCNIFLFNILVYAIFKNRASQK